MTGHRWLLFGRHLHAYWNWKCALLSAVMRSLVYMTAMMHARLHDRLAVAVVEIAYVTLTAGIYAGMQQRVLALRSRLWGNVIVVLGVPAVAQVLDWLAHRVSGAAVSGRTTLAVSVFAAVSAWFHLHVMRNGVFLAGKGRSLVDDFRRVPRLVGSFVTRPAVLFADLISRAGGALESDTAL